MEFYGKLRERLTKPQVLTSQPRSIYFGRNVAPQQEVDLPAGPNNDDEEIGGWNEGNREEQDNGGDDADELPLPDPSRAKRARKFSKTLQAYPNNAVRTSRYTRTNFLPKFLFEQFGRVANFYYLCIIILQSLIDSPVSPYTAAIPILLILLTTGIKQGYEDWRRHKADAQVNSRPVQVIRDDQLMEIRTKDVVVGDLIKLEAEDQVPADLLLLGSSDEFLRCTVTTANLDGETSPKIRYIPPGLPRLRSEADLPKFKGVVTCEPPGPNLYEFNGFMRVPPVDTGPSVASSSTLNNSSLITSSVQLLTSADTDTNQPLLHDAPGLMPPTSASGGEEDHEYVTIPLSMENVLLRGTRVKQTEFVYGLVIYTGKETRLWQNSKKRRNKRSSVEKRSNTFVYVFISAIFVTVVVCTVAHYVYETTRSEPSSNASSIYGGFVYPKSKGSFSDWASDVKDISFGFAFLFQSLIPISLYTSIELQKFLGSKFFVYDVEMTCTVTNQPPVCNTSDLNEELGQIQYLFTDKTGTLTENVMQLRYCSVGSRTFAYRNENLYEQLQENTEDSRPFKAANDPEVEEFLKILSLCHTVQLASSRRTSRVNGKKQASAKLVAPTPKLSWDAFDGEGDWEYQASSPDEKALLEACYRLGVKYVSEREGLMTLDIFGRDEQYKRHFVLEFDSDRKCMSVIVEDDNGDIWLYAKGAESAILPRCESGSKEETLQAVVGFANIGMRTLVVAKRRLHRVQLEEFSKKLSSAKSVVRKRFRKLRKVYDSIECHMTCVGATGVEDIIQDGVLDLLQSLSQAGIRIWMLTGDKLETGMMVAVDAGLVTSSSVAYILESDATKVRAQLERIKKRVSEGEDAVLAVDGIALESAMKECPDLLQDVALVVSNVLCCRMSPLQKARIVHMVKRSKSAPITAAVGDGGNDVAMIQEAHVGFGIMGKEGRQASRSADFALARTAFLKKAILVHGHWYYVRLVVLIKYIFYKSIVLVVPQFLYGFFSAFSTQTVHHSWALLGYGALYTTLPILAFGIQEQPYPAELLMRRPSLYQVNARNYLMTWWKFTLWTGTAVWHGLVCFLVPYFFWSVFPPISDWGSFSFLIYAGIIGVVNMKLTLETRFYSWITISSHVLSYVIMIVLYSIYCETNLVPTGQYQGVYFVMMSNPLTWIVLIGVHTFALFPDMMYHVYQNDHRYILSALFGIETAVAQPSVVSTDVENSVQSSTSKLESQEVSRRVSRSLSDYEQRKSSSGAGASQTIAT